MIIKGVIASALVGITIPVFAVGLISGMVLARAEPRKSGCNRCCMICNRRCKTGNNDSHGNDDREFSSNSSHI